MDLSVMTVMLMVTKVHAVVLNLPAKSCGEQAMKRTAHEGGLQGPEAKRIAHGMAASLQRNGMPSKAEGFVSILVGYVLLRSIRCRLGLA